MADLERLLAKELKTAAYCLRRPAYLRHAPPIGHCRQWRGLAPGAAAANVAGPSVKVAFDADGNPTKAALGFARSNGVEVSELSRVETEKANTFTCPRWLKGGRPPNCCRRFCHN
ncbi:MAG: glycine--tRNA ligase subunit beta [Syntrophotaleaceae bacterium]